MFLILTAVSQNDSPLTPAPEARFDDNGGTIGRADHNTLALPDPERFISRLQAEVVASGNSFLIRNVGSANAILVGEKALSSGESTVVRHGDEIRIGGYVLKADCPVEDVALQETLPPPPSPPPLPPPERPTPLQAKPITGLSNDNPFSDLLGPAAPSGPAASGDPFADLFGAQAPAPGVSGQREAQHKPLPSFQPAPAGIGERSSAWRPQGAASATAHRLPDDFDPFAAPSAPAAAEAAPMDPFADLMANAPSAGIDQAFGLAGHSKEDPLAHFMSDALAPPGAGDSAISTDPLMLFGGTANRADPAARTYAAQPAQSDHLPALNAAYAPPRVKPPPAPAPAPAPEPMPVATRPQPLPPAAPLSASGEGQDAQVMWDAFCAGAGVSLPLPPGQGTQRMQAIGMMMRAAVEGTLQLMAVRASTKHELRAAVTVIQQRQNNPLKFAPDAVSGIEQLVQPPARGFLDGPAALEDAMNDLVGHSIGTVAGMRAAIEGMLGRFDPAALEAKLVGGSVLDSLLPQNRRARLWDLYLQHHEAIREEAQEDFHNLFGRAFLAAYEQQIERLRLEKKRR